MQMITQVFTQKNQQMTIGKAMMSLSALNPSDPYKKKKAAGSLGGASRWSFIELNRQREWERKR